MIWIRSLFAISCCTILFIPNVVLAQKKRSAFQVCFSYVNEATEMNYDFYRHRANGRKLIAERRETLARLVEAKSTIEYLKHDEFLGSMALLHTQIEGVSLEAELDSAIQYQPEFTPEQLIDVRHTPENQFKSFSSQVDKTANAQQTANALVGMKMQFDVILQELKTTKRAQGLAAQRFISLVEEHRKVLVEMLQWQAASIALFNQYWEFSDVVAVKSDLELRAALRELEKAEQNNPGAVFARAITLMRLGKYEESTKLLTKLTSIPAVRSLAFAARAEALARAGHKKEASSDLRETMPAGNFDVRIRIHRAQYFGAIGDLRRAELEWEAVLKNGGHEIAARRAIALINASYPKVDKRREKKAKEQAYLASKLAGDDWSCEVALALAAAVEGNDVDGIASLERARNLAIGENQAYCNELTQNLKSGVAIAWKF